MITTQNPTSIFPAGVSVRYQLQPGDIGAIVRLHGVLYAREYGYDSTFEAYVAGPLAAFVLAKTERDRLWIVERDGQVVGSIAIVASSEDDAQLRWFLLDPSIRGQGLGRMLLQEALRFAVNSHFRTVFLWTEKTLEKAARLYRSFGFTKIEEVATNRWGVAAVEEKYQLLLPDAR